MDPLRKPPWLKKRVSQLQDVTRVKSILREGGLCTVCEEARCPNIGECFSSGVATFLLLGSICTRNCGFCAVDRGTPDEPDETEPRRVAEAVRRMGLSYVVITSVTRDDLPDGGASQFAQAIRAIRETMEEVKIEVLIPDFRGRLESLKIVLSEKPDVVNHNIETVKRLYYKVRPGADYGNSLELLKRSKTLSPDIPTKSGFMLGLGEERQEVVDLMRDLREVGCDFLTIGQYLQPRRERLPVVRYVPPEEFEELRGVAESMGFKAVSSGPFVRSSFHASSMLQRRT